MPRLSGRIKGVCYELNRRWRLILYVFAVEPDGATDYIERIPDKDIRSCEQYTSAQNDCDVLYGHSHPLLHSAVLSSLRAILLIVIRAMMSDASPFVAGTT